MTLNMKMTRLLSVLIPLAGVQACADNGNVDLGTSVTGASLTDYVDEWDGYTEAQQFVFGSDRIRVRITADGQGTLTLGESQTYPPATDPNVGYPPNEDPMSVIVKETMFRPGAEYPLHGVKVESKRIRFTVSTTDFYKGVVRAADPRRDERSQRVLLRSQWLLEYRRRNVRRRTPEQPIDCAQGLALHRTSRLHLHGQLVYLQHGLLRPVRRRPTRRGRPAGGNVQQRHRTARAAVASAPRMHDVRARRAQTRISAMRRLAMPRRSSPNLVTSSLK